MEVYATFTATYIEYTIGTIPSQVTIKKGTTTLTSSSTVHYGDVLTITYTETDGYMMSSFSVKGATSSSTNTYKVTGNVTVMYCRRQY